MATYSSTLAWRIPWIEEPDSPWSHKEADMTERLSLTHSQYEEGFPGGSDSKESACNEVDLGSIPGLGRPHGEGNDDLLQYSCLENSMDRGA